jgi:Family of unknown function (DUF5309)
MPIQGLRTTGNFESNQRPKNWREAILLLMPNGKAPLTALMSQAKSKTTDDPEFSWFEKVMPSQRMTLSADITSSATTILVTSGASQLRRNHVIRVEKADELMFVTQDPLNDTTIQVQRAFAGSTAAAVTVATDNPNIHVVGTAMEEGSLAPTGVNYDPTKRRNYTQIFRNTLEMTRTASKTRLRTGDAVKEAKREALQLHSMELEKAFIFGQASEGTYQGKPMRTTGGVISFIDPNNIVNNTDGVINISELEGWLERMFRYGSTEKIALCGNLAVLGVQQAIRKSTTFNIQTGIKEYGMNVSRLICPFGELVMKTHPLFNQLNSATGYNAADSWMLTLDMDQITYRNLSGDDMRYEKDLQENGLDGEKSGYLTEAGLEVAQPMTHFLIKGIKSGNTDGS